ncbi:J domain-containing protein [Azoarcus sp. L1K30]|uniref:J domain-containing protein n=1 Tax=Azoarcus sp. L1K30 TaxID=2820277 RepID=UPI0032C24A3F
MIWNGEHGLVTTATLGRVEAGPKGRRAWLEEPFDMVGPFDLDALEAHGRIAFAACIVMSRQRWQDDQVELRRGSLNMRRAAQQRMNEEFSRFSSRQRGRQPVDEQQHREALDLPTQGKLERREVNAAFRRLAQKAHPDAGGNHEQFVRISKARQVLLASIS